MLIDSNILIYALNLSSPKNLAAQHFLQSNRNKLIFSQQNIFETLRILTHSKFPNPFSAKKAIKAVEEIAQHATIITPNYETQGIAFELIKKYNINGTEIFDAYLVSTALSNDIAKIATDNLKHLKKYQEISAFNPFQE